MKTAKTEDVAVVPLTDDERANRDHLEAVVDRGLHAFLEVGRSVAMLQKLRLYRETHSLFEKYVIERFDLRHSHAHRLIGATKVIDVLSPMGETLPSNERQIRPLVPLLDKPKKLREAWEEIVRTTPVDDNGVKLPIAGKRVETIARKYQPRKRHPVRIEPEVVPEQAIESVGTVAEEIAKAELLLKMFKPGGVLEPARAGALHKVNKMLFRAAIQFCGVPYEWTPKREEA